MARSPIRISENYADRPTRFKGIWTIGHWRFKVYTITHHSNTEADERTAEIAGKLAAKLTTQHGSQFDSYGLGYIILHRGMDSNFIVITWWAGENTAFTFSYLSALKQHYRYRNLNPSGCGACVWDALIHFHERNAWVQHVLRDASKPNVDGYLRDVLPEKQH